MSGLCLDKSSIAGKVCIKSPMLDKRSNKMFIGAFR
jgi:hypothetical protein